MKLLRRNVVVEPLLRLRLFGVVEGWSCTGVNIWPRGRKAQAILAYMALAEEPVIPRARLTGLLWSPRWDEQARASLRQSLMELRRAISAFDSRLIDINKDRVGLDRRYVWIDGLSAHDGAQDPELEHRPDIDPNRLCESLTGIDPKFDDWIEAMRHQLRQEVAEIEKAHASNAAGAVKIAIDDDFELLSDRQFPGNETISTAARPGESKADAERFAADVTFTRRLTVSVVPFLAIGRLEEDYLPQALAQETVSALAKFRWLLVRLGQRDETTPADYQLEGFVRRVGTAYRISVRLIEPASGGAVVWSHDEDASIDVLEVALGNIAERIVGHVDPHILAIETRKAMRLPTKQCAAYECVLRAIPLLYRFEQEAWQEAQSLLDQAIAKDPDHGRAYAFSALNRVTGLAQGWTRYVDVEIQTIAAHAARAVECDPYDSMALAICAHVSIFTQRDFPRALAMFEVALRRNPNCSYSWAYSAMAFAYGGQVPEATARLERARELMIYDPFGSFFDAFSAVIAYFSEDWDRTIALCERQLAVRPSFTNIRKILVGALARAERHAEARHQHVRLMQLEPGFNWAVHLASYPFGRDQDRLALAADLARAGLLGGDGQRAANQGDIVNFTQHSNIKRGRS